MASNTKITRFKRAQRAKKAGKARKAHARNHGTTPKFAVHSPEAIANAPAAQLSPAVREAAGK